MTISSILLQQDCAEHKGRRVRMYLRRQLRIINLIKAVFNCSNATFCNSLNSNSPSFLIWYGLIWPHIPQRIFEREQDERRLSSQRNNAYFSHVYLTPNKTCFYTYHLKPSVVLKGIEPDVKPEDIAEALKEKRFCVKGVHNFKNRNRKPQPLFKIQLAPENKPLQ